jgi:hypothetical protein
MRNLFIALAGIGLLCAAAGCTEGHLCGYCDCDPGHDRCTYYFGPGVMSNYHPLYAGGAGLPGKPVPEQAPAPQEEMPKDK